MLILSNLTYANNHYVSFDNKTDYDTLLVAMREAYTGNNPVQNQEHLYVYNADTHVAFKFDDRVYYKWIGFLNQGGNWQNAEDYTFSDIPEFHYSHMPGNAAKYTAFTVMDAFMTKRNDYFNKNHSINGKEVNNRARAIALMAEAVRFDAVDRALHNLGSDGEWQYSWKTLANNWENITNKQFTIPVTIPHVCQFMKQSTDKDNFKSYINGYLGKDQCIDI